MAKYGGSDVGFLLVGGYDLLGTTTDISAIDAEAVLEESHTLGDAWAESLGTGLKKATFSQNGFYDDDAAGINAVMADNEQTQRVICLAHEGNTAAKHFIGLQGAFGSTYSRIVSRGKLHKANVKYTVTGSLDDGIILQALTTKTADWDTEAASYDSGASSVLGGAAYQQVTTFSGFTGYVGKIRHSSDNLTFANLCSFTNVTTARSAERVAVAVGGTINRYLAASGDVTGSGTLGVFIGFARYA